MTAGRTVIHEKLHLLFLAGIVLTLPFAIKLNSICIILCALNWIVEGNLAEKIKRTLADKISLCWILLYALHVLSTFTSINQHEANAILERRLSFIAFPLLLYRPLSNGQIKILLYFFVATVTAALMACYFTAFQKYSVIHQADVFYYHQFSAAIGMNAVYLSAYLVFAINILIKDYFIDKSSRQTINWVLLIFFIISLLLLSSKMMLLILLVNLIVWTYYLLKTRRIFLMVSGALILFTIAAVFISEPLRKRFTLELNTNWQVVSQQSYTYNTPFTGSSLRLVIWKFCMELLNEKHAWVMGVGTGDLQDQLDQKYKNAGMYTGNPQLHDIGYLGYGPHNEYLEILLALGIVALLLLVTAIGLQLYQSIIHHNYLLIQLSILAISFFVTESALGTNKGIVFLMLFFMVLKGSTKNI